MDRGDPSNALAGIVWVPLDLLGEAKSIAIEPRPGSRIRYFPLDGLTGLRASAVSQGCSTESRFVEQ